MNEIDSTDRNKRLACKQKNLSLAGRVSPES